MRFFALVLGACLPVVALAAGAAELPKRKAGLWETKAMINGSYRVQRRCFEAGERSAFIEAVGLDACMRSVQKASPGWLMQADCAYRGLKLWGGLQVAGDFTGALHGWVRTAVTEAGETRPAKRTSFTFTSRRLGECGPPR